MYKRFLFPVLLLIGWTTAAAQWTDDPSLNTLVHTGPSSQALPLAATTPDGGCYIAWLSVEAGYYNVRLQRFDPEGVAQWGDEGILVCDQPTNTWVSDWDMAVDQEEHAVLVYTDIRDGVNTVAGYRISPEGVLQWGDTEGLVLSDFGYGGFSPVVAITSDNHAVFAWGTSDLLYNIIYLQRVTPAGETLWGEGVTVSFWELACQLPQLVPALDGDVVLTYSRAMTSYPFLRDLWAQKFDSDGLPTWAGDMPLATECSITFWTKVRSRGDGTGGVFCSWNDDRDGDMMLSAWVQHLDTDGQPTMPVNGTELSLLGSQHHMAPEIAWLPEAECLLAFWEEKNGAQSQGAIYGQRLSLNGERLWGDNGVGFQNIHADFHMILAARHLAQNQAVVFFSEFEAGSVVNSHLRAVGVDMEAEFIWGTGEVVLSDVTSEKMHTAVSECSQGQWIVAWEDGRNGNGDIYAQNLNSDGTLGPGGEVVEPLAAPSILTLRNYPNPFNPATTIEFTLTASQPVRLEVFDLRGRLVEVLAKGECSAGTHHIPFNGSECASGVYFYSLSTDTGTQVGRMMLMR